MPLVKSVLENDLYLMFKKLRDRTDEDENPDVYLREMSKEMANIIDKYIKTGDVTTVGNQLTQKGKMT